jgi:hypothetical protein
MRLLSILLLSLLVACSTPEVRPTDPTSETPKVEFKINPEVMKNCSPLISLENGVTFDDVLVWYSKNAELYGECKSLNDKKLRLIKELTGEGQKQTTSTSKN